MTCEVTTLSKVEQPELPGAMIMFAATTSSGSHEDAFGVGTMDISLHRPGQKYPWLDLCEVNYSAPTPAQYMYAETSPNRSIGSQAKSNIHRRVSKTQARYINLLIQEMLMNEFKGIIPPDDEIKELAKQRFPLDRV